MLRHYSSSEVKCVRSEKNGQPLGMKPNGFWVSVDGNGDGWADWCRSDGWGIERLTHTHDVELQANANILCLCNAGDIDAFTEEYKSLIAPNGPVYLIDWKRVATQYQGIIITPYVWSRRLDHQAQWYYGWDCASGCIWDAGAVASVRLTEVLETAP